MFCCALLHFLHRPKQCKEKGEKDRKRERDCKKFIALRNPGMADQELQEKDRSDGLKDIDFGPVYLSVRVGFLLLTQYVL